MWNYIKSIASGSDSSQLPQQLPANPENDLLVVSDKECGDDFCEITVRPMTWSEVAAGSDSGIRPKIVKRAAPPHSWDSDAVDEYPYTPVVRNSALESNELYGDIGDNFERRLEKGRRRRKSRGSRSDRERPSINA